MFFIVCGEDEEKGLVGSCGMLFSRGFIFFIKLVYFLFCIIFIVVYFYGIFFRILKIYFGFFL